MVQCLGALLLHLLTGKVCRLRKLSLSKTENSGDTCTTYLFAKDKVWSTGNGIRNSFKSTPEVGTTNFYIEPGTVHPDDLIKDITSGLYVTDVMGMHTANPISGDFSVGASGIWIENGRLTKPVRGVAIAGNILDLLNEVEEVGSDLTFFGGKGSPTIRVSRMMISGS